MAPQQFPPKRLSNKKQRELQLLEQRRTQILENHAGTWGKRHNQSALYEARRPLYFCLTQTAEQTFKQLMERHSPSQALRTLQSRLAEVERALEEMRNGKRPRPKDRRTQHRHTVVPKRSQLALAHPSN